ncbi:MAG: helix-turn-helix domain-containing protein [Syntrophales bacterium]|nr:helix-turn-helix domain-containing protein [Syntrophales bacterium]
MNDIESSEIITVKELAQHLKLAPTTIINLTSRGVIPGFRIGKSWRFDAGEIRDFIEKAKEGGRPQCS